MVHDLKEIIDNAWDNREILQDKDTKIAIKTIIDDKKKLKLVTTTK